jgi:hypothetical protein
VSDQSSAPSPPNAQTAPIAGQPTAASAAPSQAAPGQQPALGERASAIADEKPEIAAGAGFAAGFLFAMILRRLAS